MRTMLTNWLKLSVAIVVTVTLANPSIADDNKLEDTAKATTAKVEADKEMSARDKLVEKRRMNAIAKTQTPVEGFTSVDLFEAMAQGEINVSLRQKDATVANIIVTNNSAKPLAIKMPATFSTVPVLRQFGAGGGGGGLGGGGGGLGGGGGQGGGGNQGAGVEIGGRRLIKKKGGGGGQQGGGGGGGVFNIPPGRTGRVAVTTVCLEEGKPDPRSSVEYKIQPLSALTTDPRIEEMCRMIANDEIMQPVAQAAAWHMTDNLSWQELLVKNKLERMDGYFERYFHPQHIFYAQRVVTATQQRAEARAKAAKNQKSSTPENDKYYYPAEQNK